MKIKRGRFVMSFNIKIKNIELRSCNEQLFSKGRHTTAEIVKWNIDHCYTIAYWKDGDLKYVGIRPLDVIINNEDFNYLIRQGYELMGLMKK